MGQDRIDADTQLTSYQVGDLLQVNPSSVNKWVRDGRIRAFRTPGGHHRISAGDLVSFLRAHDMPVPKALKGAAKRRVLLAIHDKKRHRALKRKLTEHESGIDLRVVDSSIDALVLVGAWAPSALVLDVDMPDIDGVEICRKLRATEETKDLAIILMGAMGTKQKKAFDAGATAVLETEPEILEQLGLLD